MSIKLKDILNELVNESPDEIEVDGSTLDYLDGAYTFFVYYDFVDNKFEWSAYNYANNKMLSGNPKITDEIYNINQHNKDEISLRKWPDSMYNDSGYESDDDEASKAYLDEKFGYSEENINRKLKRIDAVPAHRSMVELLSCLKRCNNRRNDIKADGRLFFLNGKYYFAFWSSRNKILTYKRHIIDFIDSQKINRDDVFIEDEYGDNPNSHWYPLEKYFNTQTKTLDLSPEQEKLKKIKQDLHINKGMLDKAILQVLQSQPKSMHDIVVGLEKKLNMPMAQIRHIYGELPLGRVGKALKEYIKKL